MNFREILCKLSGHRFCCCSGCCGKDYSSPAVAEEAPGFDTVLVIRLMLACLLFAGSLVLSVIPQPWRSVMLGVSTLIAGYDIVAAAILSIMGKKYSDKTIFTLIAIVIAVCLGDFVEAAALVLLFQLGSMIVDYVFIRTRDTLLSACADFSGDCVVLRGESQELVASDALMVGDKILVHKGDYVPCDCTVLEGGLSLDLTPLGTSGAPLLVREGEEAPGGSFIQNGSAKCEVTAVQSESAAARMTKKASKAAETGDVTPPALRFFLEYFSQILFIIAVLLAAILPFAMKISFADSLSRAIVFLVVANPCAMLVAVPLIRLGAICGTVKDGALFSSCTAMDSAASASTAVFDMTGTLTDGGPRVSSVKSGRMDTDVLLKIVAHAMAYSNTPVARAIVASYGGTIYIDLIEKFLEIPGSGVEVFVDGVRICAGSRDLMTVKGVSVPDEDKVDELAVYVSIADNYAGRVVLSETLREDAADGISDMLANGVENVAMFTDVSPETAVKISQSLGIREYYCGYNSARKLSTIESIKNANGDGRTTMFIGSGEKPLGRHTAADLDVIIRNQDDFMRPTDADLAALDGSVISVVMAMRHARYAGLQIRITLALTLILKLLLMALAVFGIASLWFAAFMDAAAAVGAVLLSVLSYNGQLDRYRLLNIKLPEKPAAPAVVDDEIDEALPIDAVPSAPDSADDGETTDDCTDEAEAVEDSVAVHIEDDEDDDMIEYVPGAVHSQELAPEEPPVDASESEDVHQEEPPEDTPIEDAPQEEPEIEALPKEETEEPADKAEPEE